MRKRWIGTLCGLMVMAGAMAQGDPLRVDQIIQMLRAGVSEGIIIEKLKLDGCDCRASAAEIMTLRGAEASDELVREVIAASSRGGRQAEPQPERRPLPQPRTVAARGYPGFEMGVGANWLRFESGENLWGWQVEGQGNLNRWIGLFGEFSHHPGELRILGIKFADFHAIQLHGGPKLSFRNDAVTGFLRGGPGVTRLSAEMEPFSGVKITVSESAFSWIAGGGLDVNLTPGLAIRVVQADYYGFRRTDIFGSETINNVRVGFGVVFKGQ